MRNLFIPLLVVAAFFSVMGFVGLELIEKFNIISSTYHAALSEVTQ